jgi:hypothetical protein
MEDRQAKLEGGGRLSGIKTLAAVDVAIPVLGLLTSAALFGAGLHALAQGCLAGAALASADWLLIRVIFGRLEAWGRNAPTGAGEEAGRSGAGRSEAGASPGAPKKIVLVVALGIKFIFLAVFIYLVINKLSFDPYGVALGVGSLPAGIIAASLVFKGGDERGKG